MQNDTLTFFNMQIKVLKLPIKVMSCYKILDKFSAFFWINPQNIEAIELRKDGRLVTLLTH